MTNCDCNSKEACIHKKQLSEFEDGILTILKSDITDDKKVRSIELFYEMFQMGKTGQVVNIFSPKK